MGKLRLKSRLSGRKPRSNPDKSNLEEDDIEDSSAYIEEIEEETIEESAADGVISTNEHTVKEEIISLPEESNPEDVLDHAIMDDVEEDSICISEKSQIAEEGLIEPTEEKEETLSKKKRFGLSLGRKRKKTSEAKQDTKKAETFDESEKAEGKSAKKKSRFSLNFGRKNKSSGKNTDKDESDSANKQGQESAQKSSSLVNKIEQIITPKPESIEEMEFVVGELSVPAPGVPQKDVDITYEVTPGCQYVHIGFEGESLVYHCMEPPMSESEEEAFYIIKNAFDKMAHSEILLVEEEDRVEALRDRFELIVDIYRLKLSDTQKDKFFYYLHKKYMGFDRMDLLMKDPYIEDITCNGPYTPLYVNHRVYGSVATDVVYEEIELNNFVMRMAQAAGRHISVLEPIRDATLVDGSRANLTLGKEVTKRGSTFTIRRFKSNPVSCIDLMNYKTYDSTVLAYFWLMVEYKRSVLAAGGTASGKTTTLNALGAFIPPEYKIVSIEDTAEMNLMHPNWTQSITRAGFGGNEGGKSAGDIELYDLLKAALRQRPEYIVVGEVRGAEAGTLFQAISVGHPCMGTIHAGSIHELLSRVESEPMNVPRNLFASVDMVIFNAMIKVGEHFLRRALRIVEIVELDPERGDLITNPVFKWNPVTDEYEYSGSSALFDAIYEEFGIDQSELVQEMNIRAKYLESLASEGITEYEAVAKAIRKYSRHKDELMEMMH